MALQIPKKIVVAPDAVVCVEATFEGDITIGSGTIVHPSAIIRATNGPILIGENNNIEETAVIENVRSNGEALHIGNNNVFEIESVVQATRIGDNNVFAVRSRVGPNTVVTNGCYIGTNCSAIIAEELPENLVIFGESNNRRIAADPPQVHTSQLECLRKLLPSFHNLIYGINAKKP